MTWKPKSERSAGWTLVEILIVLAIVAILAGLLVPVLGLVKRRAKAVSCLSNLHQIGVASLSYMADWEDKLPPLNPRTQLFRPNGKISDPLRRYGTTKEVYHCPDWGGEQPRISEEMTDYEIRFGLPLDDSHTGVTHFWQIDQQPSSVIAYCMWNMNRQRVSIDNLKGGSISNGTINTLVADGSVKAVPTGNVKVHAASELGLVTPWQTSPDYKFLEFPGDTFPPVLRLVD